MSAPTDEIIAALMAARQGGLCCSLNSGEGLAHLGILEVSGPDASSFLHSQITSDILSLELGDGHLSARVTRTGHLRQVFSVHRIKNINESPAYWLLTELSAIPDLYEAFEQFLFADDVKLTNRSELVHWYAVQGAKAAEQCEQQFGPIRFEPWDTLPEFAIRTLARDRSGALNQRVFAIRRTLTGDTGYLIGFVDDEQAAEQVAKLRAACVKAGFVSLEDNRREPVLEALRIEAGIIRAGADTPEKKRLLPEMGIEGQAVSYTKGCYLGQEVIARVRTYGSVPSALRALQLDADSEILQRLPAAGSPLTNTEGKNIGHWVHRLYSPLLAAPVATAYLNRDNRTPGQELKLLTQDQEPLRAIVKLLPLYSAPDQESRAFFLYDRAIRTFASGAVSKASQDLEEALRLNPALEEAYEALGVILARSGLFHEAIDFFRRLEEIAPTEPLVNTNLSLYYMKIGDKPTAEDEAAKAVQKQFRNHMKSKGKSVTQIAEHELVAKRQEAERKKAMFNKVLAFDAEDTIALFGLGSAYSALEEWEAAAEVLERALGVDKNNSAVYLAHGKALESLGERARARSTYKAGMAVASKRGDLMPLREMEHRALLLDASRDTKPLQGTDI